MFGMSDMHFTSVRYQLLGQSLAGRLSGVGIVGGGAQSLRLLLLLTLTNGNI